MGYLVKHWDNAVCSNFIGGIAAISIGSYLVFSWIASIIATTIVGFTIIYLSERLKNE